MNRLTKAAIATGGAAVLLLGGAGTLAYWTAEGTATGADTLTAGTLEATDGSCAAWVYAADAAGAGDEVDLIVPGDKVSTTCTVTVTGTGDHLKALASLGTVAWDTNDLGLANPTVAVGDVTVVPPTTGTAATITDGLIDLSGTGGAAQTLQVPVTVEFPYGDGSAVSFNGTQAKTAVLDDVVISLVQQNPNATPTP